MARLLSTSAPLLTSPAMLSRLSNEKKHLKQPCLPCLRFSLPCWLCGCGFEWASCSSLWLEQTAAPLAKAAKGELPLFHHGQHAQHQLCEVALDTSTSNVTELPLISPELDLPMKRQALQGNSHIGMHQQVGLCRSSGRYLLFYPTHPPCKAH